MATNHDVDSFQDPLENYDPKSYGDALEKALAEETVAVVQHVPFVTVPPDLPICRAVGKLAGLNVACLLVAEDDRLVGIITDRDILNRVALEYQQIKDRPVSDIMTTEPVYVYESDAAAAVLTVMAEVGYRHVPVLNAAGQIVGIVSPQRVTNFLQKHFAV